MRTIGLAAALLGLAACALYTGEGDDDDATPTITVAGYGDSGEPLAGHTVLFLDADDAVVDEAVLDASGVAQGAAPDGGSAVLIVDASAEVAVWRNVHIGETLTWGHPRLDLGAPTRVALTFPAMTGAVDYVATTSCGTATSSTTSIEVDFCDDHDVAIVARDLAQLPLGTLRGDDVDVDVTGAVDLTGVYAPNEAVAIDLGSAPAGLSVEFTTMSVAGALGVIDGHTRELVATEDFATLVLEMPAARTAGSTLQTVITTSNGDGGPWVDVTHYTQSRLAAIYYGGSNAPELGGLAYDPSAATVSWTSGAASRPATGTVVRLALDGATRAVRWNVALASDGTAVRLPALPAPYAALAPAADDAWTLDLVEYVNDEPIMLPNAHGAAFQIDQLPSPLELMIDYTYASAASP